MLKNMQRDMTKNTPEDTAQDSLIQNLIDAGCDRKAIHSFMNDIHSGNREGQLNTLICHRRSLLEELHCCQEKIDCLDHLICQIKKETTK